MHVEFLTEELIRHDRPDFRSDPLLLPLYYGALAGPEGSPIVTKAQLRTTRQTVERLVKADRSISAAEIARQAGVSRERARQILDDLGL
jgi:hypothetical protein